MPTKKKTPVKSAAKAKVTARMAEETPAERRKRMAEGKKLKMRK